MTKKIFIFWGFVLFSVVSLYAINLSELRIIAKDGTFLGTFENEYSSNSIYNSIAYLCLAGKKYQRPTLLLGQPPRPYYVGSWPPCGG
jgi:hypothetical protein